MRSRSARPRAPLERIAARMGARGARIEVELPAGPTLRIGEAPARSRVQLRDGKAVASLARGDHVALAEAFLAGRIEIEGPLSEALLVVLELDLAPPWSQRLRAAAALRLGDLRRLRRASIAFHYDRPPEFFLPWFDRWRSYTHGLYASPDEDLETATERKLQRAYEALRLQPGMRVLDVGGGWGPFVEYAGERGVRVETLTLSAQQRGYLERLIRERDLPCKVSLADFFDVAPTGGFDGAVLMGSLEHLIDYRRVAHLLAGHLTPEGRVWADFCAQRGTFQVGGFLARHVWPGTARYVEVPALRGALAAAGFRVHELEDDTASYACTVRDWATRLEAIRDEHAARWGEPAVRTFLLFLWGSYHYLRTRGTQAHHLVAGREAL